MAKNKFLSGSSKYYVVVCVSVIAIKKVSESGGVSDTFSVLCRCSSHCRNERLRMRRASGPMLKSRSTMLKSAMNPCFCANTW